MKQYKKSFIALVCFIVINSTFLYAQSVGYLRIIDNSNKNNDYKDCQYNRFDDLLISNMNQNEINVIDFNFSQIENLKLGIGLQSGTFRLPANGYFADFFGKSEKQKRNFRKKMDVDYLIYCAFDWENSQEKFMSQLVCGTDFIRKYNVYDSKYFLKFKILNLNDFSTNDLIYKDFHPKDSDLSVENFNTNTNVNNWVKDILDVIQKSHIKTKNNSEENERKLSSVKTNNNNSISNINNFSNPRIMVLPKKIDEKNYKNGEYYLNKEEKMIIASLKKVLEDNKLKTIGFESVIKNISERRLLQFGTKVDLKTLILESNEADFFVEFENLNAGENTNKKTTNESKSQPINNKDRELMELYGYDTSVNSSKPNTDTENCIKSYDFKIRNYATSEDIASDLQEINTCGSIDEYKKFANKILNNGAISKIKNEFQYLIENGKKISVFFTFSESSNKKLDDKIQGIRISQHIENCIKDNSFNGKFILGGVVNNYMSFPQVAIPFIDKNNGQTYTTSQFSNIIRDYLENYLEVKEVTVTGSSINFIIN
jgi:hypothetical protein